MSKLVNRKTRANLGMVLGVSLLLTATSPRADDGQCDEFRRCSSIEDSAARLACYDSQSARQRSGLTAPDNTVGSTTDGSADDPGSESINREKGDVSAIRATVTSCRKDANGKYHFYFENGQVWKQSDQKRLKYKECEFAITITKDFFGLKMQPDGGKSRIRITRVK